MRSFLIYFGFFLVGYLGSRFAFPIAYKLGIWAAPNNFLGISKEDYTDHINLIINISKSIWLPLFLCGHVVYIKLANKNRKYGIAISVVFILLATSIFWLVSPKLFSFWWLYIAAYTFYIIVALVLSYEAATYFKAKKLIQANILTNFY